MANVHFPVTRAFGIRLQEAVAFGQQEQLGGTSVGTSTAKRIICLHKQTVRYTGVVFGIDYTFVKRAHIVRSNSVDLY